MTGLPYELRYGGPFRMLSAMDMDHATRPPLIREAGLDLCAAFAAPLILIEFLKGHRSSFWMGIEGVEWVWVAAIAAGYVLALVVLGLPVAVATRFIPGIEHTRIRPFIAPITAALCAWTILSVYQEPFSRTTFAAVAAGFVGLTALFIWLRLARFWRTPALAALLVVPSAAAILLLHVVTRLYAWHEWRPNLAAGAALVWFAFAFAMVLVAWRPHLTGGGVMRVLTLLVLAGGPFLLFFVWPKSQSGADRPNVLLITADAMRGDWASFNGGDVPMPNVAALADRGALFKRAYSLAPWTIPSVRGLLTSTYPPAIPPGSTSEDARKRAGSCRFRPEAVPVAEAFEAAGYRTAAFIGNPIIGIICMEDVSRGFDSARTFHHFSRPRYGVLAQFPMLQDLLAEHYPPARYGYRPLDTTKLFAMFARNYLHRYQTQPFFLWVHLMDPHDPYAPPLEYLNPDAPWPIFSPVTDYWGNPQIEEGARLPLDPEAQEQVRDLYRQEMMWVDHGVGEIMGALSDTGLKDETVVMFTSDHGEAFWEHGKIYHGHAMYEAHVRVPLVLAGPEVGKAVVNAPVSLIDAVPTLADYAGVAAPDAWAGESLRPSLEGADSRKRLFIHANQVAEPHAPEPIEALVAGPWKFIRGAQTGDSMLFHLERDPLELDDMAADHPDLVEQFTHEILEWRSDLETRYGDSEAEMLSPEAQQELEEQLRAIGYAE